MSAATRDFWLRRLHDGKLSWHAYSTAEKREWWAAKYRARGDSVWIEGEDALVILPPRKATT